MTRAISFEAIFPPPERTAAPPSGAAPSEPFEEHLQADAAPREKAPKPAQPRASEESTPVDESGASHAGDAPATAPLPDEEAPRDADESDEAEGDLAALAAANGAAAAAVVAPPEKIEAPAEGVEDCEKTLPVNIALPNTTVDEGDGKTPPQTTGQAKPVASSDVTLTPQAKPNAEPGGATAPSARKPTSRERLDAKDSPDEAKTVESTGDPASEKAVAELVRQADKTAPEFTVGSENTNAANNSSSPSDPPVLREMANNLHDRPNVTELPADGPRGAADESPRLAAADRVRFVQRVARAVDAARPDGEIRLRLRPPELGSLHLRLRTENGALAARIETETAQARTLLTERLPELRERLAEMNIRVERFEIEWQGSNAGGQSPSFTHHGDPDSGRERTFASRNRSPNADSHNVQSLATRAVSLHRGDLDVVI